jgi:hypothetical protein
VTSVVVEARFAGPPHSGQGGYVAGLLAREVGNPAEVTLRLPPPLERPLAVAAGPGGGAELRDGDDLVAAAEPVDALDVGTVAAVRPDDAAAAAARALAEHRATHPFPGCFGCGPDHPTGLHLLAGRVDEQPGVYAVPWAPADDLADPDGTVRPEFVWAALDCPTFGPLLEDGLTAVLGRTAVDVRRPVGAGDRYVITSWRTARDGRKHHVAGALSNDAGDAVAFVRATWIEVDPARFAAST